MRMIGCLAAIVCCFLGSGCGTIFTRATSEFDELPLRCYRATQYDVGMICEGGGIWAYGDCDNGIGTIPAVSLHVLDVPISLVTDTLFLPFDVFRKQGNSHSTE
jgi:uncharacterized protein YceK